MNDSSFMQIAIDEAKKAYYPPLPNPRVGAVLVDKQGTILSKGYHAKAGDDHAERMALKNWSHVPSDATLYVTLEPCNFFGKTPPCLDLLLEKKVKNVVIGTLDPNPLVAGQSVTALKEQGLNVKVGILEQECKDLSTFYNTLIRKQRCFVSVKAAITLDGKIAMPSGESQWITSQKARDYGHTLRSLHEGIAVGSNTLQMDNPRLTDRTTSTPRNPHRILFTNTGDIPLESHFYCNKETKRFIFVGSQADKQKLQSLKKQGFFLFQSQYASFPVEKALEILYKQHIYSVLIEGGRGLISSFLKADYIDQIYLFQSGKIIASNKAASWCEGLSFNTLDETPHFKLKEHTVLDNDILTIWQR